MSDQADQMAPDASPGEVSKKSGVRRVNNMPMYILAAALGAFLLVMMLVAADRAAKQNAPAQGAAEKAGNTSMFAKEIVGDKTGGTIEAGLAAQAAGAGDRPGVCAGACRAPRPGRAAAAAQRQPGPAGA
jgi:hypothetical protein